ncbi:sialate O-acetylesterase [Mariniflexile litorale]|uniref:Sialate O-acetylesterase n=1 Tax=Mariniflexile litorale TaxID=3045158 RepID=A0AAU7EKZ8_9FLAO|nr:sialate O-acetylesterase [Mariniflexile sp. KMM 9835]MDQ8210590.1 sialate O-acetylesterase [Mariniflexile sp. KMM 9835]
MKLLFSLLFFVLSIVSYGQVELPLLFSDGMVLQRDKPIPVWGWANAGEKIEISLNKQIIRTKADKNGKWSIKLKPEIAGGPYTMTFKGKNTIVLKDILIGEVWICSGQSNMEFSVSRAMNSKQEINDSDFPMIRHFSVEKNMASTPKSKIKSGKWDVCNKANVGNFSAVGYYFAKKLYTELKIPIGIIHSSWGGTNVETWTSRDAFEGSDEFKDMIAKIPNVDIDLLLEEQMKVISNTIEKIQGFKVSTNNEASYKLASVDDSKWPEMDAPSYWENQQLSNLDGFVWMRKTVTISKEDANKEALLELAKIDDQDSTYVNGSFVGTTRRYDENRVYTVPENILKEGKNVIAVRIFDYAGGGGIYDNDANFKLTTQNNVIPLSGKWKFNVIEIKSQTSPNSYPSLLYNAMINPLIPYAFQGVLWYQGEANVNRAQQYKKAFPLMITDWRNQWQQGDFPFYFVQLSSYDEFGGNSNKGSKWAELREAQTETLQLANTGMCVTTDIGNAKDIHPTNKQDVGKRLAAIALNNVYNKEVVFSGPTFKSMEIKADKIILTFDNIGRGLMTTDKYGYIKGFEIAGTDKVFHYAKAFIKDDKVIVYNENVSNPVAIHYGWADDAGDCNLYNSEKLPSAPFRTDNWETLTKNETYKAP